MDLLALTSGAIGVVNPLVLMVLKISTGYTQADDGAQVPSYATPLDVRAQVQPLTYKDLLQLDAMNQQGSTNSIYIEGHIDGIVRSKNKGGDLIIDDTGQVWLVTQVLEYWPDWTKVAVTLQTDTP